MLTVLRGIIGSFALCLTSVILAEEQPTRFRTSERKNSMVGRQLESIAEELALEAAEASLQPGGQEDLAGVDGDGLVSIQGLLRTTSDSLWVAGAEMGFWNFMGTALQVDSHASPNLSDHPPS
jgi:hypothetical protein